MKENIEVETIVKGLESMTPQNRECFLCAIGNINVDHGSLIIWTVETVFTL